MKNQGGSQKEIEQYTKLHSPQHTREISANRSGFIQYMDTYTIGLATVTLGCGRTKITDSIDPTAGMEFLKKTGEKVQKLKDSASSYYYEALRLKLDTEKREMNPGFKIAEEVVLNYLRLNAINHIYKQGVEITKKDFSKSFWNTANKLFYNKNHQSLIKIGFEEEL